MTSPAGTAGGRGAATDRSRKLRRRGGPRVKPRHPAQYIVVTFLAMTGVGTLLLMAPIATRSGHSPPFVTALFTATSAACVTGLTVVDTPAYWSGFGHGVIMALIQIGGLGIMTMTSILVIVLSRRLGMRQRLLAAAETGTLSLGDVTVIVVGVVKLTIVVEATSAAVLFLRFWLAHGEPFGHAVWLAVFHSVSAFNNAGFALFSNSLVRYHDDEVILIVVAVTVAVGSLGYPVWRQIWVAPRAARSWNLHTKITVMASVGLIVAGWLAFMLFEWTNPATFGPMSTADSVVNGLFHSVSGRTAGFNAVDIAGLDDTSHLVTMILMFIGGASGSTAGGIKVTTFALLGWVMWAEMRGERDVEVFRRRVPTDQQRQALTVALTAVGGVVVCSLLLLALTPYPLTDVVFEAVSALATAGVATGLTPELPVTAQLILIVSMLGGRVGPPTLFAALVLRDRQRLYRHSEERIIIG